MPQKLDTPLKMRNRWEKLLHLTQGEEYTSRLRKTRRTPAEIAGRNGRKEKEEPPL